jgi:hypothetical protein
VNGREKAEVSGEGRSRKGFISSCKVEGVVVRGFGNQQRLDLTLILSTSQSLKMQKVVRPIDQSEGHQRYEDFADGANGERPPALFAEITEAGSQADSSEGQ